MFVLLRRDAHWLRRTGLKPNGKGKERKASIVHTSYSLGWRTRVERMKKKTKKKRRRFSFRSSILATPNRRILTSQLRYLFRLGTQSLIARRELHDVPIHTSFISTLSSDKAIYDEEASRWARSQRAWRSQKRYLTYLLAAVHSSAL